MKRHITLQVCVALAVMLSIEAQAKGAAVTAQAKGTFQVKIGPLTAYDVSEGTKAGRMSIDKEFGGDLTATSKGEMLTSGSAEETSGVYVAIETVQGTLHGRKGSFILHHTGIMERGKPSLSIHVVPDSGTGELAGITGRMNIIIAPDGGHSYELDYVLPAPAAAPAAAH